MKIDPLPESFQGQAIGHILFRCDGKPVRTTGRTLSIMDGHLCLWVIEDANIQSQYLLAIRKWKCCHCSGGVMFRTMRQSDFITKRGMAPIGCIVSDISINDLKTNLRKALPFALVEWSLFC